MTNREKEKRRQNSPHKMCQQTLTRQKADRENNICMRPVFPRQKTDKKDRSNSVSRGHILCAYIICCWPQRSKARDATKISCSSQDCLQQQRFIEPKMSAVPRLKSSAFGWRSPWRRHTNKKAANVDQRSQRSKVWPAVLQKASKAEGGK